MKNNKTQYPSEIRILYGDAVTVLPMTAADAALRASGSDCKILMCLAADASARSGIPGAIEAFAERIDCTVEEVERAVAYWRGAGVLAYAENDSKKKPGRPKKQTPEEIISEELKKRQATADKQTPPAVSEELTSHAEMRDSTEKKPKRVEELPNYTIEELSALLESRKNLSLFIDECQRAYGRMFNPRDVSKILGLHEYLSLSEEYVLTLLRYFGEMPEEERKSLHYVERMAFSLTDEGITDTAALRDRLDALTRMKEHEGQIRTIFGVGTRSFTAKEKKAVMQWIEEFRCDMDMIRLAYERTVNATSKPSILYASKILERWNREGLKTVSEVEASEVKPTGPSGLNFDTGDFFEAALRNSYGETYEQTYRDSVGSAPNPPENPQERRS